MHWRRVSFCSPASTRRPRLKLSNQRGAKEYGSAAAALAVLYNGD